MQDKLIYCFENYQFVPEELIIELENYLNKSNYDNQAKKNIVASIYIYNDKVYNMLKMENKQFKDIIANRKKEKVKFTKEVDKKIIIPAEEVKDNSLKIDVSFYLELLKDSNTYNDIVNILPDSNTDNYNEIINLILLYYYGEIIAINEMLKEMDDLDLKLEKDHYLKMIEYIKKYRYDLNNTSKEIEKKENKLVFLTTHSGNICVKNDIEKDIVGNQYSNVYELIDGIKHSVFKNVKMLNNNELLNGMYQVRKDEIRVTFKRLSSNIYIILSAFYKDFQTSHQYKNFLNTRYSLFLAQEEEINKQIENSSFIVEQDLIYEELKIILSNGKRGGNGAKVNRKN